MQLVLVRFPKFTRKFASDFGNLTLPPRQVKLAPDRFYHLYNRGNNKEPIFLEQANYRFFLEKFVQYFPADDAEIHAYCLLPNHFHMLIRLKRPLEYSLRMQHFSISYAKSLNSWSGRVGHVFQGRFKAKLVGSRNTSSISAAIYT